MTESDFKTMYALRLEHEVELGEIDMFRHVNNARYAVWAETIRSIYFTDVFASQIDGATGMILAKHEIHYEAPLRYRERVMIGGRVARFGTKSFEFETGVWSLSQARRVCRSVATLVAYDYEHDTSVTVPDDWRTRSHAFEGTARLDAPAYE